MEGDSNPLLEWRLAPTLEENKAKPDTVLSQVYLTFGRSRNSPSKDPTLRLWLAAKVEGKHKIILIADASVNFKTQLRANEVRLFQTERCKNPDLIFMVQTLPGIHFYQSNYPYQQIDQDNIWERWQPSAEALASTPGRGAITPPPPSPRATQESGTAEFQLPKQNPLIKSESSLQVDLHE